MTVATMLPQALSRLLDGIVEPSVGIQECQLTGICMDSRQAGPGTVFLALAKQPTDRLSHIEQAIERGACAVLLDADSPVEPKEQVVLTEKAVPAYPVKNLSQQAGYIAARFYQHPSEQMTVIAVTGTNGKTSVSQFIAQALEVCGKACGIIGTMGAGRIRSLELTGMTTPDPVTLQGLLAEFVAQGCSHVVMEASSHALEQGRLNSVDIDVAVLTNLTRDHLDYHQTMERYAAAKLRLFEMPSLTHAVINRDDRFGQQVLTVLQQNVTAIDYSCEYASDLIANNINCHTGGIEMELNVSGQVYPLHLPILGRFNVDNILATAGVLHALGFTAEKIVQAMGRCYPVSGRMEAHGEFGQPAMVIDYAHTPDALEQALKTLRAHLGNDGRLWCVFGCGGDRDKGKRPLMGEIAEQWADKVIITDDNPRTEDHVLIVSDILAGCKWPENIHVEHDRHAAIVFAARYAKPGDIVLVAGKGHEAYQEINHIKHPFNDAAVVTEILADLENDIYNVAGGH